MKEIKVYQIASTLFRTLKRGRTLLFLEYPHIHGMASLSDAQSFSQS